MNIIAEIQDINKKLDILIKTQGDTNMSLFDFTNVKNDFQHALSIIDASKTAIGNLKNTVESHVKTIASHVATIEQQAATIASHEATISAMAEASTEFGSFANTIHSKFTEFENFLASAVTPSHSASLTTSAPVVAPVAPVVSTPEATTVTPVANVVSIYNVDALYANAVGVGVSQTVTIAPLHS